jgi:hypothetical protein
VLFFTFTHSTGKTMKTIKFDLKLKNGEITLRTLDDLEENLSPELLTHFHSGKLAKWLRVRKLEELAEKMEALRAQYLEDKNELDIKLFKNLCEIFVSEVSEEDAREAMQNYQPATLQNSNDEEIESLKAEIEQLKAENEILKTKGEEVEQIKAESEPLKAEMETLFQPDGKVSGMFIIHDNGTVTDTRTGLMWKQDDEVTQLPWIDAIAYARTVNFAGYTDWRVPTIDELASIIDESYKPTIDPVAFYSRAVPAYWSSTVNNDVTFDSNNFFDYGMCIDFRSAYITPNLKTHKTPIRLVRG